MNLYYEVLMDNYTTKVVSAVSEADAMRIAEKECRTVTSKDEKQVGGISAVDAKLSRY